jgi:hypothetical protein
MSRYGRDDVYQFGIASGASFEEGCDAPLLIRPPGEGWELIHIQFVADYLTVWRRQRKHPGAVRETKEPES